MKKKIVCLFLLFIVSGCSINYNLEIGEDLSISENVEASENTIKMQTKTNLVGEAAVYYLHDMFSPKDEEFNFTIGEAETIGYSNRSFLSLEEFSKEFKSDVFENIIISKNNNIVNIYSKQTNKLGNHGSKSLIYDDISVNISVPFVVLENNADEINGNVYTWDINKNNLKEIKLSFNTKDKTSSVDIDIGKNTVSINYTYVVIFVIIVVLIGVVISVIIKNKKNNSF